MLLCNNYITAARFVETDFPQEMEFSTVSKETLSSLEKGSLSNEDNLFFFFFFLFTVLNIFCELSFYFLFIILLIIKPINAITTRVISVYTGLSRTVNPIK